jgi:hypothetical protein
MKITPVPQDVLDRVVAHANARIFQPVSTTTRAARATEDDERSVPEAPDLLAAVRAARGVTTPAVVRIDAREDGVPEPPCLLSAVRAARKVAAPASTPLDIRADGVPEPIDLIDAILAEQT